MRVLQARVLEKDATPSPPGDLPDLGIEPVSPGSPALAGGFFTTELPRKRLKINRAWANADSVLVPSMPSVLLVFIQTLGTPCPPEAEVHLISKNTLHVQEYVLITVMGNHVTSTSVRCSDGKFAVNWRKTVPCVAMPRVSSSSPSLDQIRFQIPTNAPLSISQFHPLPSHHQI